MTDDRAGGQTAETDATEAARVRQAVTDLQDDYRAAHLLVTRGRVYDRCSCGWYGSNHPLHASEQVLRPGQPGATP